MAKLPRIASAAVALHHSNDNLNKHQQWGIARKIVGENPAKVWRNIHEKMCQASTERYSVERENTTLKFRWLNLNFLNKKSNKRYYYYNILYYYYA